MLRVRDLGYKRAKKGRRIVLVIGIASPNAMTFSWSLGGKADFCHTHGVIHDDIRLCLNAYTYVLWLCYTPCKRSAPSYAIEYIYSSQNRRNDLFASLPTPAAAPGGLRDLHNATATGKHRHMFRVCSASDSDTFPFFSTKRGTFYRSCSRLVSQT